MSRHSVMQFYQKVGAQVYNISFDKSITKKLLAWITIIVYYSVCNSLGPLHVSWNGLIYLLTDLRINQLPESCVSLFIFLKDAIRTENRLHVEKLSIKKTRDTKMSPNDFHSSEAIHLILHALLFYYNNAKGRILCVWVDFLHSNNKIVLHPHQKL